MNKLFEQLSRAFAARSGAERAASGEVRVAVMVAFDAPSGMALSARRGLAPRTARALLYVAGFGEPGRGRAAAVNSLSDAAVVLPGGDMALAARLRASYLEAGVPCCVAAGGAAQARAALEAGVPAADLAVCAGGAEGVGRWLVGALPDKAAALAAGFPCCRRTRALQVAGEAARDNAMVGALTFLKGADMPAMLATEVAMTFKMASAYGLPLGARRSAELACVAASSAGLRGVARAAVRALPLPEFAVKSAVAGLGTYAMGRALMALYGRMAPGPGQAPVSVEALASVPVDEEAREAAR